MKLTHRDGAMVWFASQDHEGLWLEPCEMSYHDNKIAINKLAEYEDAEEHGWLVILPCKVGDVVYYFDPYDGITSGKITMIQQKADKTWKFRVTTAFSHDVTIDAIGKTIFLTREEAEAALKGEK